jgi:hypothetical protein
VCRRRLLFYCVHLTTGNIHQLIGFDSAPPILFCCISVNSQTSVTVEPADGGRQSNEFEPGGFFSVSNDFQIKKLLGKTNDEISGVPEFPHFH